MSRWYGIFHILLFVVWNQITHIDFTFQKQHSMRLTNWTRTNYLSPFYQKQSKQILPKWKSHILNFNLIIKHTFSLWQTKLFSSPNLIWPNFTIQLQNYISEVFAKSKSCIYMCTSEMEWTKWFQSHIVWNHVSAKNFIIQLWLEEMLLTPKHINKFT